MSERAKNSHEDVNVKLNESIKCVITITDTLEPCWKCTCKWKQYK